MKNGRVYKSPELDVKLLAEQDVLSSSNPIGETGGFFSEGYDLSGQWW